MYIFFQLEVNFIYKNGFIKIGLLDIQNSVENYQNFCRKILMAIDQGGQIYV